MDRQADNIDINRYAMDVVASYSERTIKRLWIIILVLCLLLAMTIGMFLYATTEYTSVETEATTDMGGMAIASMIGGVEVGDSEG